MQRLLPGTRLLTRIHSILPLHLVLSLPNQLLAHVPITEISPSLTASILAYQLAAEASDSDSEDGDAKMKTQADEDAPPPPELSQLFKPGQYLTAIVTEVHPSTSSNQAFLSHYPPTENIRLASRVELSLFPEKVNEGIMRVDLQKGYKIAGCVKGEEDHGWTVDLGVKELEGFVTREAASGKQTFFLT